MDIVQRDWEKNSDGEESIYGEKEIVYKTAKMNLELKKIIMKNAWYGV